MKKSIIIKIIAIVLVIIVIFEIYQIAEEEIFYKKNADDFKSYFNTIELESKKINNKIQELSLSETSEKMLPYIPSGFKTIHDNVESGYVIEDKDGNQFVWVPCSLTGKDGNVILSKYEFDIEDSLDIRECLEREKYIRYFLESVSIYHGFYIARFEAGKEEEKLVFKKDREIYSEVTREQAISLIEEFEYEDSSLALVNSFAWDTCLKWIETEQKDFSARRLKEKEKNKISKTGCISSKNIYDLDSNGWEITTEEYDSFIVYRGGESIYETSAAGYRGTIFNEPSNVLTFRAILYKEI